MQYFGVPTCPYCKKRVNLIRTWSLKRQGEYKCPRCGGISNIFLSPLIYVFAVIAVFAGGAVYFFHKFILDDIDIHTVFQVILPFALFFCISLFQVYLEKPVIKRVSREELEKKGRRKYRAESHRAPAPDLSRTAPSFTDYGDYNPRMEYVTGPIQQPLEEGRPLGDMRKTSVVKLPEPAPAGRQRLPKPAARPAVSPAPKRQAPATQASGSRTPSLSASAARHPARQAVSQPVPSPSLHEPAPSARVVSSVEIPNVGSDFFAKYDDPAYVEERLRQLQEEKGKQ